MGARRSVREKLVALVESTEHEGEREAALAAIRKIDQRQASLPLAEPKPSRLCVSVPGDGRRPWVAELFDVLCRYFDCKAQVDERGLLYVDDAPEGRKVYRAHIALRPSLGKASVAYRDGFLATVRMLADCDMETREGVRAAVRSEHLR